MELIISVVLGILLLAPIFIHLIIKGQMNRKIKKLSKTIDLLRSEISEGVELKENVIQKGYSQQKIEDFKNAIPKIGFSEKFKRFEAVFLTNVLDKIGVIIFLVGIIFFAKYTIADNYLSNSARISVGASSGVFLMLFSLFLLNKNKAISAVLSGASLAILYVTIQFSFYLYDYIDFNILAISYIFISILSYFISKIYDQKEVLFISMIGGIGVFFFADFEVLEVYQLLILLLIVKMSFFIRGMNKDVLSLLNIDYALTFSLLAFYLSSYKLNTPEDRVFVFLFIFISYLLSLFALVFQKLKQKIEFVGFELFFVLLINAGFFSGNLYLLNSITTGKYNGLFTLFCATINLIMGLILFKRKGIDRNLLYTIIGVVLAFITLAIPIQMDGNKITLFWGAEAVILVYLASKVEFNVIRNASIGIAGQMLISLVWDWIHVYQADQKVEVFFNQGVASSFYAIVTLGTYIYFLSKVSSKVKIIGLIPIDFFKYAAVMVFFILAFTAGYLEINHHIINKIDNDNLTIVLIVGYGAVFIYLLELFAYKLSNKKLGIMSMIFATLAIIIQLVFVQVASLKLREEILKNVIDDFVFIAHYVGVLVVMLVIMRYFRIINKFLTKRNNWYRFLVWFLALATVLTLTLESDHIFISLFSNTASINKLLILSHKVAYPIVWTFLASVFIYLGTKHQVVDLRIIAVLLFIGAHVKLFAFDFLDLAAGYQVSILLVNGILFLVGSFVYQVNKKEINV